MDNTPKTTSVIQPVELRLPTWGALAAESIHAHSFSMGWQTDAFHEILYVYKGRVELHLRGQAQSATLAAGALATISSGREHRLRDLAPATLLILAFDPAWMAHESGRQSIWEALAGRDCPVQTFEADYARKFERALRAIMAEQHSEHADRSVAIQAEALGALVALGRHAGQAAASNPRRRIERAIDEVGETFFESWNLDKAARRARVSRRLFSQVHKQVTGETFVERLTRLRLEYAARMLEQGANTIIGAAFSSGFGDLAHFYRLFRRRYGRPPGEWIKEKEE